jgi:hypothetical protein
MVKTYEEMKCMPIDAPEGTKVVFAFPNNGEQVDKDRLGRLGLKVGAEFTVEETEISGFSTTLYLREFPEEWFNTVNFTLTANAELSGERSESAGTEC